MDVFVFTKYQGKSRYRQENFTERTVILNLISILTILKGLKVESEE